MPEQLPDRPERGDRMGISEHSEDAARVILTETERQLAGAKAEIEALKIAATMYVEQIEALSRRHRGAVAALDSAIGLADHWAPKTGPDAERANRELAELRALAHRYGGQ